MNMSEMSANPNGLQKRFFRISDDDEQTYESMSSSDGETAMDSGKEDETALSKDVSIEKEGPAYAAEQRDKNRGTLNGAGPSANPTHRTASLSRRSRSRSTKSSSSSASRASSSLTGSKAYHSSSLDSVAKSHSAPSFGRRTLSVGSGQTQLFLRPSLQQRIAEEANTVANNSHGSLVNSSGGGSGAAAVAASLKDELKQGYAETLRRSRSDLEMDQPVAGEEVMHSTTPIPIPSGNDSNSFLLSYTMVGGAHPTAAGMLTQTASTGSLGSSLADALRIEPVAHGSEEPGSKDGKVKREVSAFEKKMASYLSELKALASLQAEAEAQAQEAHFRKSQLTLRMRMLEQSVLYPQHTQDGLAAAAALTGTSSLSTHGSDSSLLARAGTGSLPTVAGMASSKEGAAPEPESRQESGLSALAYYPLLPSGPLHYPTLDDHSPEKVAPYPGISITQSQPPRPIDDSTMGSFTSRPRFKPPTVAELGGRVHPAAMVYPPSPHFMDDSTVTAMTSALQPPISTYGWAVGSPMSPQSSAFGGFFEGVHSAGLFSTPSMTQPLMPGENPGLRMDAGLVPPPPPGPSIPTPPPHMIPEEKTTVMGAAPAMMAPPMKVERSVHGYRRQSSGPQRKHRGRMTQSLSAGSTTRSRRHSAGASEDKWDASKYSYPLPSAPPFCLWLGNVPSSANAGEMREFLSSFGIMTLDLRFGRRHGAHTCCYVDFPNLEFMKQCLRLLDSSTPPAFRGRVLDVDINEGLRTDRESAVSALKTSAKPKHARYNPYRRRNLHVRNVDGIPVLHSLK